MAKAKVKLGLTDLSLADKVQLARQIVAKMTGNAAFPTPTPGLGAITNAANAAQNAFNDAQGARATAQQKTVAQNEKEMALDDLLAQLASYVDNVSAGNEETILSSGMGVRAHRAPAAMPAQVQSLAATAGDAECSIDLSWDAVDGAKSYIVETSTVTGTGPWAACTVVTKSRATIKNLTTGQRLWFRIAAVGAGGQGPWSDPATKIVP